MRLRRHFQQLSSIVHLTEQKKILMQRVTTLEAKNEEMCDAIKEVDASVSIGSVMVESLLADGDCDYYSYNDNDDDMDSNSVPPMEPTLKKQYM